MPRDDFDEIFEDMLITGLLDEKDKTKSDDNKSIMNYLGESLDFCEDDEWMDDDPFIDGDDIQEPQGSFLVIDNKGKQGYSINA